MNKKPEYITPAQYAKEKGIARQTAYAHLQNGTVKRVEIAGRLFVKTSSIN